MATSLKSFIGGQLDNVLPRLAPSDQIDRSGTASNQLRPCPRGCAVVVGADRPNQFIRQFSACETHPLRGIGSSFSITVAHVVKLCSQKQMRWIDACWNVALMKDKQPPWNSATKYQKRSSMGSYRLPCSTLFDGELEASVTVTRNTTDPRPTRLARLANVRQKSFSIFRVEFNSHATSCGQMARSVYGLITGDASPILAEMEP